MTDGPSTPAAASVSAFWALPLLLLAAFAQQGCTDEGTLEGSLSQVYRLAHSGVRARLYDSELAIEYLGPRGSVPVRVSLRRASLDEAGRDLRAGEYDLARFGDLSGQLDDGTSIPRFDRGSLVLERFSVRAGGRVEGSFDAHFPTPNAGFTLRGTFAVLLEVVAEPAPSLPDAGASVGDAGTLGGGLDGGRGVVALP